MIEKFAVKNYKSIKDGAVLDFTKTSPMSDDASKLVRVETFDNKYINRVNFLYGKNGSGKSTMIEALKDLQSLATNQTSDLSLLSQILSFTSKNNNNFTENDFKKVSGLKSQERFSKIIPFKITSQIDNEVVFLIQFVDHNERYLYEMKIDTKTKEISKEKLSVEKKEEFTTIFDSHNLKESQLSDVEVQRLESYYLEYNSILSILKEQVKVSDDNLRSHINNVNNFFERLRFNFMSTNLNQTLLKKLSQDKNKIKEIERLISTFDISISGLEIEKKEIPFEKSDNYALYSFIMEKSGEDSDYLTASKDLHNMNKAEYSLNFKHNDSFLSYDEESSGTKIIVDRIISMIMVDDPIWVIDDYENDLHEEAVNEFTKYISKNLENQQFILVTHRLSILDLKEVKYKPLHNFVEKSVEELSSSIISLSEWKDLRSDNRNSWSSFYRDSRLAQYPSITLNKKGDVN